MPGKTLGVLTVTVAFAATVFPAVGVVRAQSPAKTSTQSASSASNAKYDELFEKYLLEARKMPASSSS